MCKLQAKFKVEAILENEKENYNLIEENFFEELQVDGDWYFKIGVGLYGVLLGQRTCVAIE